MLEANFQDFCHGVFFEILEKNLQNILLLLRDMASANCSLKNCYFSNTIVLSMAI